MDPLGDLPYLKWNLSNLMRTLKDKAPAVNSKTSRPAGVYMPRNPKALKPKVQNSSTLHPKLQKKPD